MDVQDLGRGVAGVDGIGDLDGHGVVPDGAVVLALGDLAVGFVDGDVSAVGTVDLEGRTGDVGGERVGVHHMAGGHVDLVGPAGELDLLGDGEGDGLGSNVAGIIGVNCLDGHGVGTSCCVGGDRELSIGDIEGTLALGSVDGIDGPGGTSNSTELDGSVPSDVGVDRIIASDSLGDTDLDSDILGDGVGLVDRVNCLNFDSMGAHKSSGGRCELSVGGEGEGSVALGSVDGDDGPFSIVDVGTELHLFDGMGGGVHRVHVLDGDGLVDLDADLGGAGVPVGQGGGDGVLGQGLGGGRGTGDLTGGGVEGQSGVGDRRGDLSRFDGGTAVGTEGDRCHLLAHGGVDGVLDAGGKGVLDVEGDGVCGVLGGLCGDGLHVHVVFGSGVSGRDGDGDGLPGDGGVPGGRRGGGGRHGVGAACDVDGRVHVVVEGCGPGPGVTGLDIYVFGIAVVCGTGNSFFNYL